MTPEQQAAMQKAQAAMKDWRLSVSMDKYKAFRKMYNDAGVSIYAFKLPPTMNMSDHEYDYIWNVGETLGANHITMRCCNGSGSTRRSANCGSLSTRTARAATPASTRRSADPTGPP
jgi:hypothetical protein